MADVQIRNDSVSQAQRDLDERVKGRTIVAIESHAAEKTFFYERLPWYRLVFDDDTALVVQLPAKIFTLPSR